MLTCIVNVAVELLCVVRLEHEFSLDQVFYRPLHKCIVALSYPIVILSTGNDSVHELLLSSCWKERLLVRDIIGGSM